MSVDLNTELYRKADNLIFRVSVGLFAYSLVLAYLNDSWWQSIVLGGAMVLVLGLLVHFAAGRLITRLFGGSVFMLMCALHIHQANGMIEMHFGIFVLLAFLLYYQDWRPIFVAAAVIAVHHVSFYFMQAAGWPVVVMADISKGLSMIMLHAAYVVVETAVLLWLAIQMRKQSDESNALMTAITRMTEDDSVDLRQRAEGSSDLIASYNAFLEKLSKLMGDIATGSQTLADQSQTLTQITSQMKHAAAEQEQENDLISGSVREINLAVAEVSRSATQASDGAQSVDESAKGAAELSRVTQSSIKELAQQISVAAETIETLNQNSQEINEVLTVIQAITEQTNLLALNAAIEAARAGEHGRGFAVVADEVRDLAQRTHGSTKQIESMIHKLQGASHSAVEEMMRSKKNVDICVDNVESSAQLMQAASHSIRDVSDMNSSIAAASTEQSAVLEDLTGNLEKLVLQAQAIAGSSSQSAEATEQVRAVSEQLKQHTKSFKF